MRFDPKVSSLPNCVRSLFLLVALLLRLAAVASAGEVIDSAKAVPAPGQELLWYDIRLLGVEGRGWQDTEAFYDRLPAKAEGVVRGAKGGVISARSAADDEKVSFLREFANYHVITSQ